MYMKRMVEVGKAENGFVVECRVPLKPEAKPGKNMDLCCSPSAERQYVAKDAKELAALIGELIPLLDSDYKTEDEFDVAFSDATKNGGKDK